MSNFYTMDALEFLKMQKAESIDFILTDPPYFINEEVGVIRRSNKAKFKGGNIDFKKDTEWDRQRVTKAEYRKWMYEILDEYYRILRYNKHLVMFCDKRDINYFQDYGEKIGFKVRQMLIREKTNPVPRVRKISPMTTFEVMMWLTKGRAKVEEYNRDLGMIRDIFRIPIPRKEGGELRHPTQKPLMLLGILIALFSKPYDLILDSFAGSGSVGIMADVMNRRYLLNEIDPKWKKHFSRTYSNRIKYAEKIKREKIFDYFYNRKTEKSTIDRYDFLLNL